MKHERKQDLKIVEAQNSIDVLQKHQSIPGQFLLEIFVTTTQTRGNKSSTQKKSLEKANTEKSCLPIKLSVNGYQSLID